MTKEKANELYNRVINGQVDNYFKRLSNEDFEKLLTALADDDVDDMAEILADNLKKLYKGFETPLGSGSYDSEVRELAERIKDRETEKRKEEKLIRIIEEEPRLEPIIYPSEEVKLERKLEKPISVTGYAGKRDHRRTKGKIYTPREIKFLQRRADMTGGEVFREYLETFGNVRTKSAVKTKFYRVR